MSVRDVSAVVVNHNTGLSLVACVASLHESGIDDVVVVDNASADGSLALLHSADPTGRVIETGRNLGYGTAANRGVAVCTRRFVLICNADLLVTKDVPDRLAAVLEREADIGVVGPRIVESTGATFPSARAFPRLIDAIGHAFVGMFSTKNRWSERYRLEREDPDTARDVDWISGACMLVRKVAFDSIGGFDEGYFMYVEDLDLCWRLRRGAWRTRFEPAVQVTHEGGASSRDHPYQLLVSHHRSAWRFARRSASRTDRLLLPVIGAGIAIRGVIALGRTGLERAKARFREPRPVG